MNNNWLSVSGGRTRYHLILWDLNLRSVLQTSVEINVSVLDEPDISLKCHAIVVLEAFVRLTVYHWFNRSAARLHEIKQILL